MHRMNTLWVGLLGGALLVGCSDGGTAASGGTGGTGGAGGANTAPGIMDLSATFTGACTDAFPSDCMADDETINIAVTATDPDGDPLAYTWSSSLVDEGNAASGGTINGSGATVAFTAPRVEVPSSCSIRPELHCATSRIQVTVSDGRGGVTEDSIDILVGAKFPILLSGGATVTWRASLEASAGATLLPVLDFENVGQDGFTLDSGGCVEGSPSSEGSGPAEGTVDGYARVKFACAYTDQQSGAAAIVLLAGTVTNPSVTTGEITGSYQVICEGMSDCLIANPPETGTFGMVHKFSAPPL
jgi:hypothetical protein